MLSAHRRPVLQSWLSGLLAGALLLLLCARGNAGDVAGGAAFDSLVARGAAVGAGPEMSGPVFQPETAISPSPTNGHLDIPVDVTLSWRNGGGATGYRVSFGTTNPPPLVDFLTTTTNFSPETLYSPPALQYNTTYFWRIDAVDSTGVDRIGNVWRFTTTLPGLVPTATDGIFQDRIRVTWNAVAGANAYRLSRSLLPLGPKTVISNWGPDTTFDDLIAPGGNVVPGQTYYYWVQSSTNGGVSNVSAYSPYAAGYANPNTQTTYKVTTKNCDVRLDNAGEMFVVQTDPLKPVSVKVTEFGGIAMPPITVGPTTKTASIFYIRSAVHPGAEVWGTPAQISTQVPMKSVMVHGDLASLNGYVERLTAYGFGRVAMSFLQDVSNPALSATPDGPYSFIEALPSSTTTHLKASVSLTGLTLVKFSMLHQDVTSVKVMAKKGKGPLLKRFTSGGNAGVAENPGNDSIEVGSLGALSVQSGALLSKTVVTSNTLVPTTISTRGLLFTDVSTTGVQKLAPHRGDVLCSRITSVSPLLNVTARGGDIRTPILETSSAIGTLQTNFLSSFTTSTVSLYGGMIGTTSTQIVVRSGEDNGFGVSADMKKIFGAKGVSGDFYAGVRPTSGTLVPDYVGNIGSIKVGPVVAGEKTAPAIRGFATVHDGTKLREELVAAGVTLSSATFAVYDLAAPLP